MPANRDQRMSTLHLISVNISGLCARCGVPQLECCHIFAAPGDVTSLYCPACCPVCSTETEASDAR